jgi:hypothetical protein
MQPMRRADNLTTVMCRLSRNLEASTSWNGKGLSRPVMALLYLLAFANDACFWLVVIGLQGNRAVSRQWKTSSSFV